MTISHEKYRKTMEKDMLLLEQQLSKTNQELSKFKDRYKKLEADSAQVAEGLEEDKKDLREKFAMVTEENKSLEKINAGQNIDAIRSKQKTK